MTTQSVCGTRRRARNSIEKGERIVLFTDGLSEARNADKQLFGLDRICDSVSQATGTAADAAREVAGAARAFAGRGGLTDDLTLVSIRRQ